VFDFSEESRDAGTIYANSHRKEKEARARRPEQQRDRPDHRRGASGEYGLVKKVKTRVGGGNIFNKEKKELDRERIRIKES